MIQVVGINGFKRSGKGTVANFLAEDCTTGVVHQIGFADKVKLLTAQVLGFEGERQHLIDLMDQFKITGRIVTMVDEREFSPLSSRGLDGRRVLQNMGTEARLWLGEDLWVDQVLPDPAFITSQREDSVPCALRRMYPDTDILAITDLRFENEAQRVKDVGGVVWEVLRPGCESDGHASEQTLPTDLVDYQIFNTATLDDLRAEVKDAARETLS